MLLIASPSPPDLFSARWKEGRDVCVYTWQRVMLHVWFVLQGSFYPIDKRKVASITWIKEGSRFLVESGKVPSVRQGRFMLFFCLPSSPEAGMREDEGNEGGHEWEK